MKLHLGREDEQSSANQLLRDDAKFAAPKIAFFQYLTVAVFLFLITGFWDLQIRNPEVYQERALENSVKSIPVLAPRGKILDRDGRVIVDNHSSYSAILARETLKDEHLKAIADGLNLDFDALADRVHHFHAPKYQPIVIKEELTPGEVSFVESHRDPDTFPELDMIVAQRRLYPKDGLAAHLIGYVGEISDLEMDNPEFAKFHPGDIIGKDGLERQYNDMLMGVDGKRQVEVDNLGNERHVLDSTPDIPGKTLQLTIDLDLQVVAELALEDRRGAVVALDPRTGEVLAMVSRPAYDPNLFAARIRNKAWKELVNNPGKPLLNRAIQAQLAPGSTFKPIMALAGLETGVIDDDTRITCPGGATFYGHYYACHEVDGVVDLHKAIVRSCDTFFYNEGNRLGIDRIAQYAELAGLGHKTGIDLPHEAEGVVPSRRWKIRTLHEKWFAGENISVAIGQGATTVTPVQMASAIGGIAIGGMWFQPHLVPEVHLLPARRGDVNLENIRKVIDGMYGVVNEPGGTGGRAHLPGIEVCGKTGSAQLVSNAAIKAGFKVAEDMKDNAWFVGFAPRENPEIVVAALFENGVHGQLAAPIVRDVLKAYFDKKARLAQPQPQIARLPTGLLQAPPRLPASSLAVNP